MTDLVLDSKVRIPRRRRTHVERPRLLHRLDEARQAPLTLVSAPAGFGKTTLLTEWLAADPGLHSATAWLALDPTDDDPIVFWRYVIAAVEAVRPDAVARAQALQAAGRAPTDALLPVLLNDLGALGEDLLVVLDDFHVVTSVEVRDQLIGFLERLPPRVHVVIASRSDPALPLARWRARGDLVEVRAHDLRFSADETSAYLTGTMGLPLSAAALATLDDRTEGWIAALQLAALSMQGRPDISDFIAGFAGDDRFVVDYLVEEVLHRQPERVRRFLLQTSVLTRMEGSLCDAVVDGAGSHDLLATLERDNLFVVPLDDRRHAYRYHHLFADVLRARLLVEAPGTVPTLHARASRWYEAHGDAGEAFRHALAGGDVERAADLLELAVPALRRARAEVTLRAWMESIPDHVLRARPVLNLGYIGSLLARGELDGVDRRLGEVEHWLAPDDGGAARAPGQPVVVDTAAFGRLPAEVAVYRAGQALLTGDLTATLGHARRALEHAGAGDDVVRGSAAGLLGLAYWYEGQLDDAHRYYSESLAHLRSAGHLSDVLGCSLALADIQVAQGRLDAAAQTLGSGLRLGTAHDPPLRGTADMHVGLARLLGERGHLDAAREHLRSARDLGEHAGLRQNAYRSRLETARLQEADGDVEGALALLDEADGVFTTDFSPDVRPLGAVRARLHLAHGHVAAARDWVRTADLTTDDDLTYVREFEHLTLARVLLASARAGERARLGDAMRLLERLEAAAAQGHRPGSVVEVLALRALAHGIAGDHPSSIATLESALAQAEGPGFVRLFLDEGPPMLALLRALTTRVGSAGHAQHVLACARVAAPTSPPSRALPEPLSARELEVVRLLATDLDGPGIARTLVVSVNTVRTHTKNIYAKLGVNTRRAAVRRAHELGLLSSADAGPRVAACPDHHAVHPRW